MFKYQGVHCPHCGKEFKETDQILICPDCGTREALESIGVKPDEQEQIIAAIHRHRPG